MEMEQALIKQLITQWEKDLLAMNAIFEKYSDTSAAAEVAPGRNSVIYLLGHMVAVNDRMIEALDAGERRHADLDKAFLEDADSKTGYPSYASLLDRWKETNARLSAAIQQQSPADWLRRHHYISEADFQKEPHRNRLAILISRLTHLNTHLGQLKLLG
jgi:uncharacterized damage-inducible protein DinB